VVELIVAVITVLGAYFTTRASPTLEGRIKAHTALLKDLPAESRARTDLTGLLDREVARLVDREKRRLELETYDQWSLLVRVAGVLSLAVDVPATGYLLVANLVPQAELDDHPGWLTAALVTSGIALTVTIAAWGVRRWLMKAPT
jgi:hypothetical protein